MRKNIVSALAIAVLCFIGCGSSIAPEAGNFMQGEKDSRIRAFNDIHLERGCVKIPPFFFYAGQHIK